MGRGLCRCPLDEHQFYKHVIGPMATTLFITYYSLKSFLQTIQLLTILSFSHCKPYLSSAFLEAQSILCTSFFCYEAYSQMEAFLPTPVVPSNAPLWSDIDQDSRILKEQCGNRQLGYLQTQNTLDFYSNANDDSTCGSAGGRPSAYHSLQLGRSRPGKLQHSWTAGLAQKYDPGAQHLLSNVNRGGFRGLGNMPTDDQEKDQEAERKARLLASRFLRCDGYIKYRNRQPKEKKGNKEDAKWPDHIEDAFIVG